MTDSTAERGRRVREIREALELTQGEFAQQLNSVATSLGLAGRYDALKVSQRETGKRALDAEDYAVLSQIDKRWSWHWLAFGRELAAATKGAKVAVAGPRKR